MSQETILNELLQITKENTEVLHFLQENAVLQESFTHVEQGLTRVEHGIIRLEQDISSIKVQLSSIEHEIEEIKEKLDKLEQRTREDADASVKDILDLKRRIEKLETQLHLLQSA